MPQTLPDDAFLEMRCRCLSLASDLDRAQRANVNSDPRLQALREAIGLLLQDEPNRAERVELLFSDKS